MIFSFRQSLRAQFLNVLLLGAWCLLLDAWCLLVACCLMLEHLPDPSTKAGGLQPPPPSGGAAFGSPLFVEPFVGGYGRRSSIKQRKEQASIKRQAASIKQQALRNWAIRLWQEIKKCCFPDSQLLWWGGSTHGWLIFVRTCKLIDTRVANPFTFCCNAPSHVDVNNIAFSCPSMST